METNQRTDGDSLYMILTKTEEIISLCLSMYSLNFDNMNPMSILNYIKPKE